MSSASSGTVIVSVIVSLLSLLLSLLAGAVGWWVTNFYLRPRQRIEDLRRQAHEDLIFFANVGEGSLPGDKDAAHLALRKVGAGLIAEAESASRPIKRWTHGRGWNLERAGRLILIVAIAIDQTELRSKALDDVLLALRLPPYVKQLGIVGRRAPPS